MSSRIPPPPGSKASRIVAPKQFGASLSSFSASVLAPGSNPAPTARVPQPSKVTGTSVHTSSKLPAIPRSTPVLSPVKQSVTNRRPLSASVRPGSSLPAKSAATTRSVATARPASTTARRAGGVPKLSASTRTATGRPLSTIKPPSSLRPPVSLRPASVSRPAASSPTPPSPQKPAPGTDTQVKLLLRNLHLLDLPIFEDWPEITVDLFLAANAVQTHKARVHAIEWTFFRLFQIWDPSATKEKLEPFFPPFDHNQSVNLRASIFRLLTDLKQQNVLPRDLILRKSMLDDCKSEKVLEMLLSFSTSVLMTLENAEGRATVPFLAKPVLSQAEASQVQPLLIMYRYGLAKIARDKESQRTRFTDFENQMEVEKSLLEQRNQAAMQKLSLVPESAHTQAMSELTAIKGQLQPALQNDTPWIDAILCGDKNSSDDQKFSKQWPEIWTELVTGNRQVETESKQYGLMEQVGMAYDESLSQLSNAQIKFSITQRSLDEWSRLFMNLPTERAKPSSLFDRHKNLHLRGPLKGHSGSASPVVPLSKEYEDILEKLESATKSAIPSARRLHLATPSSDSRPRGLTKQRERRASQASGTDSDGPGYLFSPPRSTRFPIRPVASTATSTQQVTAPVSMKSQSSAPERGLRPLSLISSTQPAFSPRQGEGDILSYSYNLGSNGPSNSNTFGAFPSLLDNNTDVTRRGRSQTQAEASMTLSERTRLSMIQSNNYDGISPPRKESIMSVESTMSEGAIGDNSELMKRTRLSMSGLNWGMPGAQQKRASRQSFRGPPVVASRTSRRNTGSFTSRNDPSEMSVGDDSIAEEDPDPEYQEAFMSRPKIAASPVGSPESRRVLSDYNETEAY